MTIMYLNNMGQGLSSSKPLQKQQHTDPGFISRLITNCPLQPHCQSVFISLSVYLVRAFLYVPIAMAWIFSWQMKTGGCNLYQLNLNHNIRNNNIQLFQSSVTLCHVDCCAANAYLYVKHDYEAYENEVLKLLFTLKSVFLLFHVIQKTLFIEKNCSSLLNKQFILNLM